MTATSPLGVRLNNWLNVRPAAVPFRGQTPDQPHPGYLCFVAPVYSLRAGARILATYHRKHGLGTVAGIIARWAPPDDDNPTPAYAAYVAGALDVDPAEPIPVLERATMRRLLRAMVRVELGLAPAGLDEAIEEAMAISEVPELAPPKLPPESEPEPDAPRPVSVAKSEAPVPEAEPAPPARPVVPVAAVPAPEAVPKAGKPALQSRTLWNTAGAAVLAVYAWIGERSDEVVTFLGGVSLQTVMTLVMLIALAVVAYAYLADRRELADLKKRLGAIHDGG